MAKAMATRLYGSYRRDDASDPDVFLQGVAAIFRHYSMDVLNQVCDPFSGLPSKNTFPPSFREIVEACDEIEAVDKRQRRREASIQEQLAERRENELAVADRSQRKTYNEILDDFAQAGIVIGNRPPPCDVTADQIKHQYGISDEAWDAIPDRPARPTHVEEMDCDRIRRR